MPDIEVVVVEVWKLLFRQRKRRNGSADTLTQRDPDARYTDTIVVVEEGGALEGAQTLASSCRNFDLLLAATCGQHNYCHYGAGGRELRGAFPHLRYPPGTR
jgi:hypothetical protein